MPPEDKQGSWWQTVPGVITAVGSLLVAVTGLIIALNQAGLLHGPLPTAIPTAIPPPANNGPVKTLPSVVGVPLADARQVLKSQGFTDIHAVRKFSAAMPGTVIEQVPKPGTDLPLGQPVDLMIAARPPSTPPSLPRQLGAPNGRSADLISGVWEGPPDRRDGLPESTLTIRKSADGSYTIHGLGHCTPRPCNWGVGRLDITQGDVSRSLVDFVASTTMRATLPSLPSQPDRESVTSMTLKSTVLPNVLLATSRTEFVSNGQVMSQISHQVRYFRAASDSDAR
jgi:hypothetical protein